MTDLTPHLRQYRHNDGSEEFVFGYDHDGINRLVAGLDAEIERLREQRDLAVDARQAAQVGQQRPIPARSGEARARVDGA